MGRKHKNGQQCDGCDDIMNSYGVDSNLRSWFTIMKAKNEDLHCSCAGRNKPDQEKALAEKKSRAAFGESPHNYTPALALDLFRIDEHGIAHWDPEWYKEKLIPEKPQNITWGGDFKAIKDCPHFEIAGWKRLARVKIWDKG